MFKSLLKLTTPYLKNHISKLSNSFKTKMNTQDIEKFTDNYTWKKLTNLNDNIHEVSLQRSSHTVNLFNEKIYVFGGEHNPRIPINNHLLVYDLKSNKWEYIESNNNNLKPRLGHASCQNGDKLFLFGGRTGFEMGESSLNDLFVFDIKENIWTELKKSNDSDVWPEARSYHTMTSLKNKLYLFGGCSANQSRLNDLYEYDLNENKWKHLNNDEKIVARGCFF
jgi:N-acetylneuraminic acid mutarotase